MLGGPENDKLRGEGGDDFLDGEDGDDGFFGGEGGDRCIGAAGFDYVFEVPSPGGVRGHHQHPVGERNPESSG